MIEAKKSTATTLPVTLFDSATGAAKTGVASGDVACYFTKGNGLTSNAKVLAGKWHEIDAAKMPGLYKIDFDASDLDTAGDFTYYVKGTGISTFEGTAQVVDYLSADILDKIGAEDADADGQVV